MAQAPHRPTHEPPQQQQSQSGQHPTQPASQAGGSQQQGQQSSQEKDQQGQQEKAGGQGGGGQQLKPGQPGSQQVPSGQGQSMNPMGPPPERPGMIRPYPGERQSVFENQPGQQIVGQPAHPGHEEDRQHLRGRTVQEGSASEDKEPKPKGVPKGAIFAGKMGTEKPDAPPLKEEKQGEQTVQGGEEGEGKEGGGKAA